MEAASIAISSAPRRHGHSDRSRQAVRCGLPVNQELRTWSALQWFEQWRDRSCSLDRWQKAWHYLRFCRLLVRIAVSEQARFAPGWTDYGEADRESHDCPHRHGEVWVACDRGQSA